MASAERDSRSYIAVVLGCSANEHWQDASKLLDYGFKNFQQVKLTNPREVVATLELNENDQLQVMPRQELCLSLPTKAEKVIESRLFFQPLQDDIALGQVVGEQVIIIDGEEAGRIELVAANEIKQPTQPFYYKLIYLLAGLFVLQVIWRILRNFIRKNKRRMRYSRRSWNY